MNSVSAFFNTTETNISRLQELETSQEPRSRYIIAITPRSGSTYLCDMALKTQRLGKPEEVLGQLTIPGKLKHEIPARSPEEYLRNAIRVKRTVNNVSGLKASWFQFQGFIDTMQDQTYLSGFRYIYLTRRDLAAQAVSLYKATTSSVFHTNKVHHEANLNKLKTLDYDYDAIKNWYDHIVAQEKGWQDFFYQRKIFPLCIYYEDIEEDVLKVMKRIAAFVAVNPENITLPERASIYRKVGDNRNTEWARRFILEYGLETGLTYSVNPC